MDQATAPVYSRDTRAVQARNGVRRPPARWCGLPRVATQPPSGQASCSSTREPARYNDEVGGVTVQGAVLPQCTLMPGAELDIALLAGLVALLLLGPGRISIDRVIGIGQEPVARRDPAVSDR